MSCGDVQLPMAVPYAASQPYETIGRLRVKPAARLAPLGMKLSSTKFLSICVIRLTYKARARECRPSVLKVSEEQFRFEWLRKPLPLRFEAFASCGPLH